jgi:hypothetical protein
VTADAGVEGVDGQPLPDGRIEAVLGRSDDMRAELYVRFIDELNAGPGPLVVTGTLAGPRCGPVTTLPVTVRLVDLGGFPAAARAILTEPSYWTPELPNLYRLDAEVRAANATVASMGRLIGLRRLGVRGRSLWLEGRRWVPRGVVPDAARFDAAALRAASLAAVIGAPSESICAEADAAGVAVVAALEAGSGRPPLASIQEWAQHPAVVMTLLPADRGSLAADVRGVKGTMLVGLTLDGLQAPPRSLPEGVDCVVLHLPDGRLPHDDWRRHAPAVPVLARRSAGPQSATGREACDRLQADCAAWGCAGPEGAPSWEWAGYLVG